MVDLNESNRSAELVALAELTGAVATLSAELVENRRVMTDMQINIATIMERQSSHAVLREDLNDLLRRVQAIEARNHEQDGAFKLADFLRNFGPWVMAGAFMAWTYLVRGFSSPPQ